VIGRNLDVETIQKLTQDFAQKKNIHVDYTGPQAEIFNDLLRKFEVVYKNKFEEYRGRGIVTSEISKKKKSDTIMMEVPANVVNACDSS
jgi:hypothetical protein